MTFLWTLCQDILDSMIAPADMLLFSNVVTDGSFSAAARSLGISKQTVSARIAHLEEQLGLRLLERTTRRLRTTEAGARYYERCRAIATQIEDANREAQQQQAEPSGLLRVSAPTLYGRRYLAKVVASYLARFPRVHIELSLSDRRVNLIEEGVDVAIRVGLLNDSTLSARRLGEGHIYFVASPSFIAAAGTPTPALLPSLPCIGMHPVETWEVAGQSYKLSPRLVVNDLEVVCEAAIAGLGIAQLPSLVCRDAVREGRLQLLFGPGATRQRPVHAVFPSRRHLPPKVRHFLDTLTAEITPMLPLHAEDHGPSRRRASPRSRPRRA